MKKLTFLLIFTLVHIGIYAQTKYDYYIVGINETNLIPTSKTNITDSTYLLQFLDNELQNYFAGKTVYKYKKAFPTAETSYLKKVHIITLDNNLAIDDLFNLSAIDHAILLEQPQLLTTTPNDYLYYGGVNGGLELIKARQAWDITTGDPNVLIGISDTYFEVSHEDLTGKIVQDFNNYPSTNYHGTAVAGMAAAHTNNSKGISGIGYNCNMVTTDTWANDNEVLTLSQIPGIRVINLSWINACSYNPVSAAVYEAIWDNGVTVVCGAGNGNAGSHCGPSNSTSNYVYPASFDHTISVTSVGHSNPVGYIDPNPLYGPLGWYDVHEEHAGDSLTAHTHNDKVDVCAPGYNVLTTKVNNSYGGAWGTSFASPMVAGVCALMYSVNPCLQPSGVKDILKNTADDVYNIAANQPYIGKLGTGRVNAYEAVRQAQISQSASLDLFIKDRPEDFGVSGGYHWQADRDESPDIWVRNQPDGLTNQIHQDPEYQPTASNPSVYVYVRVRNKSCVDATGNEQLKLYWSKAATWTSWPLFWDGSQPTIGNIIGNLNIGTLPAGEETILEFQWNILNPYALNNWATCLMARVEAPFSDPMALSTNPAGFADDVYYNNNIALKNIAIVDIVPGIAPPIGGGGVLYPTGKYVFIGNPNDNDETYTIKFSIPETVYGQGINEVAEIKVIFDDQGWDIIKDFITPNEEIEIDTENKTIISKSSNFQISNVIFSANTRVPIYVGFNFLSDEVGEKQEFKYHVRQYLTSDNSLLGGEHFIVKIHDRNEFDADAGDDKDIKVNESTTVHANEISEGATYNWYDEAGNLVFTGKDFSVSPQNTETYKLEVIATSDGFKDYDEVIVEVNHLYIENISPNPASAQVIIDYKADDASSAYIMILNSTATSNSNYIINVNQTQATFNVANFQQGVYSVILICDGVAVDMKSLVVQ